MSEGELLMTRDEKLRLAEKIEGMLVGITPLEWSKWSSYCCSHGLKKALEYAKVLQNSPSLRSGPKQSYRTISEVMNKFQKELSTLAPEDLQEVFGLVRWCIVARRGTEHEGRSRR